MAELEEQAAEAQEDVQKGCFGSLVSFLVFLLVSVGLIFLATSAKL